MEISTIARHGLNPIVVVLNNHGYTTERFLLDGPFNDIQDWAYHKVPEVVGAGLGLEVRTVGELDAALKAALANIGELQPAQRPPRPLRPQPGAGTAGAAAVEDRHIVLRVAPVEVGHRSAVDGDLYDGDVVGCHHSSSCAWVGNDALENADLGPLVGPAVILLSVEPAAIEDLAAQGVDAAGPSLVLTAAGQEGPDRLTRVVEASRSAGGSPGDGRNCWRATETESAGS